MRRRRDFLIHAGLALAAPWGACKRAVKREGVLEVLVDRLVVPDVQTVLTESRALEAALAALVGAPGAGALEEARGRWRAALLAWKRAHCFRNGPMVTTGAFLNALFWPTRPQGMEALVRGTMAVDDALVRGLGVDQRGLFALESLLFQGRSGAAVFVAAPGEEGARARVLAQALARAVTGRAANALRALGEGRALAAAFAAKGQESLNLLVNQFVETIETSVDGRLGAIVAAGGRVPKAHEIEGLPSALAFRIPHALVTGTERLYLGEADHGITALVQAVAPAIDAKARTAFANTASMLGALADVPADRLEGRRPDLEAAARAMKALELAIKVDVASALGVTLTFVAGDGD